jgi:hypothetical protein
MLRATHAHAGAVKIEQKAVIRGVLNSASSTALSCRRDDVFALLLRPGPLIGLFDSAVSKACRLAADVRGLG